MILNFKTMILKGNFYKFAVVGGGVTHKEATRMCDPLGNKTIKQNAGGGENPTRTPEARPAAPQKQRESRPRQR